ncbi:argininosuccinate synthase [bacterium]|nr:argininosuccinate synthase [bacterium]
MTKNDSIQKVVLAYSGGLDTSVIVRWLKDKYGCRVIGYNANLGVAEPPKDLLRRFKLAGGDKLVVEDIRREFLEDYCFPSMRASAVYEGKYFLATSLSRPLIAKKLIDIARREGADAVAHGCTGKGNDQVRFEITTKALSPDLEVLAPVRDWEFKTRDDEIAYAQRHGIPVTASKKTPYSYDRNLWGISIECGPLEDPYTEPPDDAYLVTSSPARAPRTSQVITLGFDRGRPVSLNGKKLGPVALVEKLTPLACRYGIGRVDLVENRLVGIKSREVYEQPASTILFAAYREILSMVTDRETLHLMPALSDRYAQLVYDGFWFTPLRTALDAFFGAIAKTVTGDVRIRLTPGAAVPIGRRSPLALYSETLATYGSADVFDQSASVGFIKILGLPVEVRARLRKSGRA